MKSELRKAINQWKEDKDRDSQEYDVEMTSTAGPALTLTVKRKTEVSSQDSLAVQVDVVITIRHEELQGGRVK